MVKFYLSKKTFEESRVLAEGVVLVGKLKVGDTFNLIERYEPSQSLEELVKSPAKIEGKVNTTMTIMAISVYGKAFEDASQGMECSLILTGWDNIRANDVLIIEGKDK